MAYLVSGPRGVCVVHSHKLVVLSVRYFSLHLACTSDERMIFILYKRNTYCSRIKLQHCNGWVGRRYSTRKLSVCMFIRNINIAFKSNQITAPEYPPGLPSSELLHDISRVYIFISSCCVIHKLAIDLSVVTVMDDNYI